MVCVESWQQACRCVALLLPEHTFDLVLPLVHIWPCSLFQVMLKRQPCVARSTEKASAVELLRL